MVSPPSTLGSPPPPDTEPRSSIRQRAADLAPLERALTELFERGVPELHARIEELEEPVSTAGLAVRKPRTPGTEESPSPMKRSDASPRHAPRPVLHVGAMTFYATVKKTNLILPMITGRKPAPQGRLLEPLQDARPWRFGLALALAAAVAWGVGSDVLVRLLVPAEVSASSNPAKPDW